MKRLMGALMLCLVSITVLSQNYNSRLLGVRIDTDWATFSNELLDKYPNFTINLGENDELYIEGTCTFYEHKNTRITIYKDDKTGKVRRFTIKVIYDPERDDEGEAYIKLATKFFKNDMNMNCEVKETQQQEGDRCAWDHEIVLDKGQGVVDLDMCQMDEDDLNFYIWISYYVNPKDYYYRY